MPETPPRRARTANAGNRTARPPKDETPPKTSSQTQDTPASDESQSPPASGVPATKTYTPDEKKLAADIAGTYAMVGMLAGGAGMARDDVGLANTGAMFVSQSEDLAFAWIDLSRRNPAIKSALRKFTEVSAAGVLVGLHFSCLAPFLADRGIIPNLFAAANMNGA